MNSNVDIAQCKKEYLDLLYSELRSRGFSCDEAQHVIDKSDFIDLLNNHTTCVLHVSVSQMADDLMKKVIFNSTSA